MKKCAIGIDLGGSKIALGVVDEEGRLLGKLRYDTDTRGGPGAVIKQIVKGVAQLERESAISPSGIGIGVAGQVNPETGDVLFAPNLDWHDVPLGADVEKGCAIPVVVTNDVRAALWGEWIFGAGRGAGDLLCVFIGTGIGGGIVCGGRVLEGCSNTAGEIGHITVDLSGPLCTCGNRGCMEALAGGWAIARRTRESVEADPVTGGTILRMAGGRVEDITAKTLAQAFHAGDALAGEIIKEVTDALAAGIAALVNALNPCQIILGGGVIEGMPELVSHIDKGVRRRALSAATGRLAVCASKLGNDAGIIGAAALAMRTFSGSD
ncbi:MAG: ROK family protein [Syntrophobacteraceae bacterium]|jgi:glucokinase